MAQNDYNNTLQNNNNLLEDILNMINNFPAQKIILQSKTVSPTTSQQIITPDANFDGLDKVIINAATKQSKTVNPSTSAQIITPDNEYYGLSDVTVNAATIQSKIVTPSANTQTITPDSGYYGLSDVTVNGDSNLIASNIKNGVNIFGVTGSYSGVDLSNLSTQTTDLVTCTKSGYNFIFTFTFTNPIGQAVYFNASISNNSSNPQCEIYISQHNNVTFGLPYTSPGLHLMKLDGEISYPNNKAISFSFYRTGIAVNDGVYPVLNSFYTSGVSGTGKIYYA